MPVNMASDEPMPGLVHGFRLMVPAENRWVVSDAAFTDEELAFLPIARLDSGEATKQQ